MSPLSVSTSRTHALETGEAKLWSLLVGVNQYWDDDLPSLRYSAFDCQGLAEALSTATQGFPRKEVIVHHDYAKLPPTLETIRASLKQIARAAAPEDTILLYFSGHGVVDRHSQRVVLCLANTSKNDLLNTGLSLPEVLQILGDSKVHHQMLWLDACHSGDVTLRGAKGEADYAHLNPTPQLENVLRQRAAQSRGFYALLSCDQKQRSWEFPELKHGLFTYYLMQGLQGEAADSQGIIESDGLYKYVYHQTLQYIEKTNQQLRLINQQKRSRGETDLHPEYPLQTPKRIVEGVGELVLGLKTDNSTPAINRRRAILLDGLDHNNTTLALSKVLRISGNFELEYWPQSGKTWIEARNAIQTCLRKDNCSSVIAHSNEQSTMNTEQATVLLYLRGKIEEIEDGEAWLILDDNVKLSRSWLRQELRRTQTTQQIVVLDCPGATSLSDWIEELKLGSQYGQCLIAAASNPEKPEQFTQALLETLATKEQQVGLAVAEWITKLQVQLENSGIPLYAWLSGVQGVIEILPKNNNFSAIANPNPSAALSTEQTTASYYSDEIPSADSFPQQYSQLEKILLELVGPIAPTLLQQAITPVSNPQTWVENLIQLIPPHHQHQLKQQFIPLLQACTSQPQTKSSIASTWPYPKVAESFVDQCEQALANYIGPIASFLVQQALKSHPQISQTQLVETLAVQIPEPQKAEFRQMLG